MLAVQEAIDEIAAVKRTIVEAYSQGEARLRLELEETIDGGALAEGISSRLGQLARVRASSEEDRTLELSLE